MCRGAATCPHSVLWAEKQLEDQLVPTSLPRGRASSEFCLLCSPLRLKGKLSDLLKVCIIKALPELKSQVSLSPVKQ